MFGFISGPSESHASAGRLAGYRERIDQLGLGPVSVAPGDYQYEGGFAAALEMFGSNSRPEALFCANDLLAIGAIDALRETLCMRVPEDVIVAGFDDIPAAAWASIDLTTFVQDGALWSTRPWLSSPPRRPANAKNLRRSSFPHG